MPDKSSHRKPEVSAELIRQYLAGELDDKAMHALERQALDDPFLADALEGFDQHPPDQQVHLDDLQARLTARVAESRQTKVVPMYYRWAAAAAILLLVTSGAWWIWNQQLPKERPIVKVEEQHADSAAAATPYTNTMDSSHAADEVADKAPAKEAETANALEDKAPAPAIAAAPAAREALPAVEPVKPVSDQRKAAAKRVAVAPQIASTEAIAANNAASSAPAASDAKQLPAPDNTIMYAKPGPPLGQLRIAKGEEKVAATQKKEINTVVPDSTHGNITNVLLGKASGVVVTNEQPKEKIMIRGMASPSVRNSRLLTGKVTDQASGNGLPGVAVSVPGRLQQGTVTNAQGEFVLRVDTGRAVDLALSYIGFDNKQLRVSPNDNNLNIALAENNKSLSETVVVGKGVLAGSENNSEAPAYRRPEPDNGWKAYQQYLKNNTVYPDTEREKKISGNVRVSFKVMGNGTLQDFKIIKSMGAAFDEEAIRVIKAGPSWIPASDFQPVRIRIKVPFTPAK